MNAEQNSKTSKHPQVFLDISEFWAFQLNNEIYLRNHPDVIQGSKEYFDIILAASAATTLT